MAHKIKRELIRLKTDKLNLECHPSARRAWQCWSSLSHQFTPQNLPLETLILLQETEPLYVIRSSTSRKYSFFSGFSSVMIINDKLIQKATFCAYKNLSLDEIERLAWANILKTMLFDLDRNIGLGSMYEVINQHMPTGLCRKFFGRKTLSRARLADLSGAPESALRWQGEHSKESNNSNESILSKILKKP